MPTHLDLRQDLAEFSQADIDAAATAATALITYFSENAESIDTKITVPETGRVSLDERTLTELANAATEGHSVSVSVSEVLPETVSALVRFATAKEIDPASPISDYDHLARAIAAEVFASGACDWLTEKMSRQPAIA